MTLNYKKRKLLFLGLILTLNSYAQNNFEKGYYITNLNEKVECLIKNIDWKNSPTEIESKVTETDEVNIINLKLVKEFSINNTSKYIKKSVEIDRSSSVITELSYDKKSVFNKEQLFLKVLIEGKANLFVYSDKKLIRYFYNIENSDVEQLIYKRYLNTDGVIAKNNQYKQQLLNNLKCATISMNKIQNLTYKSKSLSSLFIEYNECHETEFKTFVNNKNIFKLNIRPRITNATLSISNNTQTWRSSEFGHKLSFGFGIECEYVLPYNNNKWAIAIEPTFQYYNAKNTNDVSFISGGKLISEANYKSIEVPVSLRHYFFLNDQSKIFVNASYVIDFNLESSIEYRRLDDSQFDNLEIESNNNLSFGIGYKQNDKYSLELRFQTKRDVIGNYRTWDSNYNQVSVIFGYTIFNTK